MSPQAATKETIDLASETLTGDVRDVLLGHIRTLQKPYARCSQDEQRDIIESITKSANHLVRSAVEIVASHGRKVIHATVEQFAVKEGIKTTLKSPNTDAALSELGNSVGKQVFIIIADPSEHTGERAEAKADPDQQVIPLHLAKEGDAEDTKPKKK